MNIFDIAKLLNVMPLNVYWKDKNGIYLGCNLAQAVRFGFQDPNEIIGKTDNDMPWADQAEALNAINNAVMTTGKEHVAEEIAQLADGTKKTFLSRKTPLLDENENVIGVLGISFDITDRKQIEEELFKAKEAAEAASRAKTEFLANMSHDVKTPMTGIVGMADIMASDVTDREADRKNSRIIHSCGMQVLDFFNNCLELSKMEMQEWATQAENFSLEDLLAEIKALFVPVAQTRNLAFELRYDFALPKTFYGHRASIYRVVLNLIGNALKFTEQGSVDVRVFLAEKISIDQIRVGIEVKDTGVGIPEDKYGVIFEKLRRLMPSYQGKVEGSGMGLYIVDQYVKQMQGRIEIKSVLNVGSTFTVFLPLQLSDASALEQAASATASIENTTQASDEQAPSILPKAPHILLVEDNPIVQTVTKMLLSNAGFYVDVAGTGTEAMTLFSPGKYGLIYMDIGLPDTDGYLVTQAMREKEKTSNATTPTPIVALTGHGALDIQAFCGQAGMQGVLSKPINAQQITDVWRRYGKSEAVDVQGLVVL